MKKGGIGLCHWVRATTEFVLWRCGVVSDENKQKGDEKRHGFDSIWVFSFVYRLFSARSQNLNTFTWDQTHTSSHPPFFSFPSLTTPPSEYGLPNTGTTHHYLSLPKSVKPKTLNCKIVAFILQTSPIHQHLLWQQAKLWDPTHTNPVLLSSSRNWGEIVVYLVFFASFWSKQEIIKEPPLSQPLTRAFYLIRWWTIWVWLFCLFWWFWD